MVKVVKLPKQYQLDNCTHDYVIIVSQSIHVGVGKGRYVKVSMYYATALCTDVQKLDLGNFSKQMEKQSPPPKSLKWIWGQG